MQPTLMTEDQVDLKASCGVKRVRILSPTDNDLPISAEGEFRSASQGNQGNLELAEQQARRKLLSQRLSNIQARQQSRPGKPQSSSIIPQHELSGRPAQSKTRLPPLKFSFGDSDPHSQAPRPSVADAQPLASSGSNTRNDLERAGREEPMQGEGSELSKKPSRTYPSTALAVDDSSPPPPPANCHFLVPQPFLAPQVTQSPLFRPSAQVDADGDSQLKHVDFESQDDLNPWSAFKGSKDENNRLSDFILEDRGSIPEPSEEELAEFLKWIESQDIQTSTFQSRLQHLTNARATQFSIEHHALLSFQDIRQSMQSVYNDLVAREQELEHFVP